MAFGPFVILVRLFLEVLEHVYIVIETGLCSQIPRGLSVKLITDLMGVTCSIEMVHVPRAAAGRPCASRQALPGGLGVCAVP